MNLIVLAGGKASRFGKNKALAKVKDQNISLIEYVISRISSLFKKIIIVSAKGKNELHDLGYDIISDKISDCGPLAGIQAGLTASSSDYNFVIACDMPYIPSELIKYMMTFKGYDVVIPRHGGKVEPLCAMYRKDVLPIIGEFLSEKRFKISDIFSQLEVKYIDEDEIKQFDPKGLAFYNINTQEEFEALSLRE